MLRYNLTKLFAVIFLIGNLCTVSSCSDESGGEVKESHVTLKLLLPDDVVDNQEPGIRSGIPDVGDPAEREIRSLKYFIYKTNPASLEVYKSITIDAQGNSNDPMWDATNKALRITLTPGQKQIYCIANWTDNQNGMGTLTDAQAPNSTTLTRFVRSHNSFTPSNPPVMTAQATANLSGQEQTFEMQLRRQIAAVEIFPMISKNMVSFNTNIVINGIKFRQLGTNTYLFPQTQPPYVPGINGVWSQSGFTGNLSNRITATANVNASRYGARYYIPEHYANSVTATQMIIRAVYNGDETYYSIILNPAPSHAAYTIERNHIYRYYVTIQGKGADNEQAVYPRYARSADNPGISNISYELEIK